jgi:bla regulator protein BlaR1
MIPTPSLPTLTTAGQLVADHLWQSTLFAGAAGGLTLILRRNRAQVRYWLWMAVSAKFLVPFAALAAAVSRLGWRWPTAAAQSGGAFPAFPAVPDVAVLMDAVGRPFTQSAVRSAAESSAPAFQTITAMLFLLLAVIWCSGAAVIVLTWYVRWRRIALLVRGTAPVLQGPDLAALRRLEAVTGMSATLMVSPETSIEPGIFGIATPVLVWPRGITERLAPREVEAILAHELCHVRRRDNLASSVHMLVQAVWWFHPLVWWLGARLVDERERACDEEVVRLGSAPQVYAESILKACRYYAESPVSCVAGVTGSNLKERIERIMTNQRADRLNGWRRLLLAAGAVASFAAPIVIGATSVPQVGRDSAQASASVQSASSDPTFEVASIKINTSGDGRVAFQNQPGRFVATNVTLRLLIRNAYQLQDFQISGGPSWIGSDHFDVVAKIENGEARDPLSAGRQDPTRPTRLQLMIRALLAERFQLAVHTETKELPVYALVLARTDGRLGPELRRSDTDCAAPFGAARGRGGAPPPPQSSGGNLQCGIRVGPGSMSVGGVSLSQLANSLSMFTGRVVLDRTGLTGAFDANLTWTPDQMPQRPPGAPDLPIDPNGPSLFTAVQEQLGLKLDSQKGPVEILVIDRAEHPTQD